jgi:hypothetical protein
MRVASLKRSIAMDPKTFNITDGPNKPTLQRALMLPTEISAHFQLEGEGIDVWIAKMEEQSDGFSFKLEGRVTSGAMKGCQFRAIYSIEGRSGTMAVQSAGAP